MLMKIDEQVTVGPTIWIRKKFFPVGVGFTSFLAYAE